MASGIDIEKGQVDESVPVNEDEWKKTFNIKLLNADSPLPSTCCIFKVPEVLRRQKELAYEPDIVSIGPFHRGADEKFKKFKLVEDVKEWYLKCLLSRMKTITLDSLIESIKVLGLEKEARGCYEPCFHLDQNHFIEMLILDGCFLIELFRKASSEVQDYDPIFHVSCMLEYLYHDLLLLENQLPWFVLEFFYNLTERGNSKPLSNVVIDFFKGAMANAEIFSDPDPKSSGKILHILDLIRTALIQKHVDPTKALIQKHNQTKTESSKSNHLPQRIPSATALSEAGVKFKKGLPGSCILNVTFDGGVFTIPTLAIDERTGPLFRNLMAFEQCYHKHEHKITSYAVLMDNLIDSNKDVDLLCEKDIVANWLSADDASKFFNDLYNDTTVIDFVYKKLCDDVNTYHKKPWNKYREKLEREYFGTPWSTISFFAAFVLLVLTFLQTIYTIHPYYHPRES